MMEWRAVGSFPTKTLKNPTHEGHSSAIFHPSSVVLAPIWGFAGNLGFIKKVRTCH